MLDLILLQIAKIAILSQFDTSYTLDNEALIKNYPYLGKKGAAFVTLKYDNDLRGCIGSIVPHQSLLDDITQNATSAAFRDPRFKSLDISELSHLSLEVSVLSEPILLEYEDYADLLQKVRPNVDGLILQHDRYQGTFLPQVWEQLPTPSLFLEHLSQKAGASPSIYNEHPNIFRYEVQHIEEEWDAILPIYR